MGRSGRQHGTGQGRKAGWRRAVVGGLLLLTAAGCATDRHAADRRTPLDDPLLGGPPKVATATAAAPLATMATPTAASGPSAADGTPASNASLATGGFRPLAGGNDLRINGTAGAETGAPNGVTLQPPTFGASPPSVAVAPGFGAAPVNQFMPAAVTPAAAPPPAAVAPPALPPSVGRVTSLDQAYAALKQYNLRWYNLKYDNDTQSYQFSCSVPSRLNPSVSRQVSGNGPTELAALQAGLDELAHEP